eukprot:scaffold7052_cov254-Pinguiococcus_pyrenoidosus.AAC.29
MALLMTSSAVVSIHESNGVSRDTWTCSSASGGAGHDEVNSEVGVGVGAGQEAGALRTLLGPATVRSRLLGGQLHKHDGPVLRFCGVLAGVTHVVRNTDDRHLVLDAVPRPSHVRVLLRKTLCEILVDNVLEWLAESDGLGHVRLPIGARVPRSDGQEDRVLFQEGNDRWAAVPTTGPPLESDGHRPVLAGRKSFDEPVARRALRAAALVGSDVVLAGGPILEVAFRFTVAAVRPHFFPVHHLHVPLHHDKGRIRPVRCDRVIHVEVAQRRNARSQRPRIPDSQSALVLLCVGVFDIQAKLRVGAALRQDERLRPSQLQDWQSIVNAAIAGDLLVALFADTLVPVRVVDAYRVGRCASYLSVCAIVHAWLLAPAKLRGVNDFIAVLPSEVDVGEGARVPCPDLSEAPFAWAALASVSNQSSDAQAVVSVLFRSRTQHQSVSQRTVVPLLGTHCAPCCVAQFPGQISFGHLHREVKVGDCVARQASEIPLPKPGGALSCNLCVLAARISVPPAAGKRVAASLARAVVSARCVHARRARMAGVAHLVPNGQRALVGVQDFELNEIAL